MPRATALSKPRFAAAAHGADSADTPDDGLMCAASEASMYESGLGRERGPPAAMSAMMAARYRHGMNGWICSKKVSTSSVSAAGEGKSASRVSLSTVAGSGHTSSLSLPAKGEACRKCAVNRLADDSGASVERGRFAGGSCEWRWFPFVGASCALGLGLGRVAGGEDEPWLMAVKVFCDEVGAESSGGVEGGCAVRGEGPWMTSGCASSTFVLTAGGTGHRFAFELGVELFVSVPVRPPTLYTEKWKKHLLLAWKDDEDEWIFVTVDSPPVEYTHRLSSLSQALHVGFPPCNH